MKKLLSTVFLSLTITLLIVTLSAVASAQEESFSYSIEDVTMTISGNGAVPDYFYYDLDYETREAIHHIIIEDGITEIGDRAFCYFYALESIELPDSLERIGEAAFDVCRALDNVTLPEELKSIDAYAFSYCQSLKELVIPESVTYLGMHVFDHATSLSYVKLPSHITALPEAFFHYCESLREVELPEGITEIGPSAFSWSGIESIIIPKGVTLIPERAFEECPRLESVTLSDKIEKIDKYGFYHVPKMKSIQLPGTLRVIEYAAFSRGGLEGELVIPEGVEEIYWKAFYESKISTLSLPSTLTYMDYAIFGMTRLTEITVAEDNPVYASYNGCLYSKDLTVLYMYTNGDGKEEVIIPASVEYLDGYSFGGNDIVKKIYLPFGIRTIHNEAIADRGYYAEDYPYYCYEGTPAHDRLEYWFGDERIGHLEIQDISIVDMPYRTDYALNESFKTAGLKVCVTDAFGQKSYYNSDFEVGEYDFSKEGNTTVPVSLWGYNVDVPVKVDASLTPFPESEHPYKSNTDITQTYIHPYKCEYLEVKFSADFCTEDGYDFVYIIDSDGNTSQGYSGESLAGQTIKVPGNSFSIRFVSDYRYEHYGFSIDSIIAIGEIRAPEISVDNYTVTITSAKDIRDMRYVLGTYTTTAEIRSAEGNVALSNAVIAKNTVNGKFIYDLPDGGVYSIWIRMNDGTNYVLPIDMTSFVPEVTTYGVKLTVDGLYDIKDYFIAKGEYNDYNEIKNNGYIVRITSNKIAGKHSYEYTLSEPGMYTVLVRYNNGTTYVFHKELVVDTPVFTPNGLQLTVSNLPDIKVIRTAYGEYSTPGQIKNAVGARAFTGKTVLKGLDEYTVQYREEGVVTVAVVYNNGYEVMYTYNVTKKTPTMTQEGSIVTFGNLDDLKVIRYAKGEYTTSNQIKNAKGSVTVSGKTVTDNTYSVTLTPGIYTFCVQYNDESYNYYTVKVN